MKYNFKDEEKIQEMEVCCAECLAIELLDTMQFTREYEGISLYAKADLITDLLRILLNTEYNDEEFTIGMVELDGCGFDYCGDYILSISDDNTIWIEPAFREIKGEWKLFDSDSVINFVSGECDSLILQKFMKDKERVMIFDFDED